MPALLGYLIAVCLLLGGGYEALQWLVAPAPVTVAKAKIQPRMQRLVPSSQPNAAANGLSRRETSLAEPADFHDTASPLNNQSTNDVSPPVQPEAIVGGDHAVQADLTVVEILVDTPQAKAEPVISQSERNEKPATRAGRAGAAAKPASHVSPASAQAVKPPRSRHVHNRSERRGLVLMTLRTIELPDGSRISRLIPYRGRQADLAMGADE